MYSKSDNFSYIKRNIRNLYISAYYKLKFNYNFNHAVCYKFKNITLNNCNYRISRNTNLFLVNEKDK